MQDFEIDEDYPSRPGAFGSSGAIPVADGRNS